VRDSHVHFFSARFFSLLTGGRSAAEVCSTLGWEAPPEDPAELAAEWLKEMDRHGVESLSLIASIPGDEPSVAAAVANRPERFRGRFLLNPLAEDALLRAQNARAQGFRTMCLFPAMHRFSIADERLHPILSAWEGWNVFVHCGVLSIGVRKKLGLPSDFDLRFSNPIDLHPVALRYPSTRFIVPHFGAGYLREALLLTDLCSNVHLDTSSSNSWTRYEGLTLEQVFRRALDVAGPGRLLFGTDSSFFPRGWVRSVFEEQQRVLARIGISKQNAASILGENLAEIE
jgi:predicted TIM-barrel fold metal-dependent hydrolase